MADRAENNKVPTRNAPNSDQEPQRSRGPDDRPIPPHRDEMNRKTAPGSDSAAPSSPAPVANRITATESPTKKACNGLLQQNLPCVDGSELARPFFTFAGWSVQPCVRPVCAVHMTAGHNALRGSGPGQKRAFDNALAHVGCPDRRIDRLCITCCSPSPTFTSRPNCRRDLVYAASAAGSL